MSEKEQEPARTTTKITAVLYDVYGVTEYDLLYLLLVVEYQTRT